jgi:hypothetical protein
MHHLNLNAVLSIFREGLKSLKSIGQKIDGITSISTISRFIFNENEN